MKINRKWLEKEIDKNISINNFEVVQFGRELEKICDENDMIEEAKNRG